MDADLAELVQLEVRCDPDAPAVVREALGEAINRSGLPTPPQQGEKLRDDARLIASELVTNAVRYSGCGPDGSIRFQARIGADALVISVSDPGCSGHRPHLRTAEEEDAPGGFGLRIVARLARRWGVERPNGHRVWAELALS